MPAGIFLNCNSDIIALN